MADIGNLLLQGGMALGQGISDYAKGVRDYSREEGMAKGMAQMIKAAPDLFGMDPDSAKEFIKQQPHENLFAYGARLGQTVENTHKAALLKQMAAQTQGQQLQNIGQGTQNQMAAEQLRRFGMLSNVMAGALNGSAGGGAGGAPQQQQAPGVIPGISGVVNGRMVPAGGATPSNDGPDFQIPNPSGFELDPVADARKFQTLTIQTAGALPTPGDVVKRNEERQKWLNEQKQVGFVPLGNVYDDNGYITGRKVAPLFVAPGNPTHPIVGEKTETLDPQTAVTLPLFHPVTGKKLDPAAAFGPNYNPLAKGAQEEKAAAWNGVSKARETLSNVNFFRDAVDAYAQDPTSGASLNALFGSERAARFKQFFTGKNPRDQIVAAQGKMYAEMINTLRNEKTGANALRTITQQELDNLQAQYGGPQMTPEQQKVLADNMVAVFNRHLTMNQAYADYLDKGMSPAEAQKALATDPRFSTPLVQQVAGGKANPPKGWSIKPK